MKKAIFLIFLTVAFMLPTLAQTVENVAKDENKFIYSNSIKLFLGDSIYVQSSISEFKLNELIWVKELSDSSNTISIKFTYDKFGMNNASILKISNPFSKQLTYKAKIRTKTQGKYSETSIMPVYPKIFGMEMWPYKIESIILYDFELK